MVCPEREQKIDKRSIMNIERLHKQLLDGDFCARQSGYTTALAARAVGNIHFMDKNEALVIVADKASTEWRHTMDAVFDECQRQGIRDIFFEAKRRRLAFSSGAIVQFITGNNTDTLSGYTVVDTLYERT